MKLIPIKATEFDTVWGAMTEAFPPAERRDHAAAKALLQNPHFQIYHVVPDDAPVGFITLWQLSTCLFAEHLCIYSAHRNGGYGAAVLRYLKETYPRIVLECEHPAGEMAARRLGFYERNGFCRNDLIYHQPAYRAGEPDLPLLLLSYPSPLADPDTVVSEIHRVVYGRS